MIKALSTHRGFAAWACALVVALWSSSTLAVELKIATLAPDGSSWMVETRKAAAEIAQKTGSRVKLQLYPGGAMGDEQAVLRKIRIGQLHGSAMTVGALAEIYPDVQIYSLPLLFESYEEVDVVRRSMDARVLEALKGKGHVSFGFIEGGFAYLMSKSRVERISDVKGLKAWLREGDEIGQAVVEEAGLSPIPLPLTDVLTGLQTGLVDTVAGPPVGAVTLQWFTKVGYLTDIPLIYTYGTIVVSERALRRLSPEDRAVVEQALRGACGRLDKVGRQDNERAMQALQAQGVEIVAADTESLDEWRQVAGKATRRLVDKGVLTREMVGEIEQLLAEHRQQPETR